VKPFVRETASALLRGALGIAVEVAFSALLMAAAFLLGGAIQHWFLR